MKSAAQPHLLTAFPDGEWAWYVAGHDKRELLAVDEPDELEWEKLWMRKVDGATVADEGVIADDAEMLDGPCWIECAESAPGAEPWMGVKYAPA